MDLARADIDRLADLRLNFLERSQGGAPRTTEDYWRSARDLELYDAVFAERIGWRWDDLLRDLARHVPLEGARTVLDWGCGTGIAARRWFAKRPPTKNVRVHLWDRSPKARRFARERLAGTHPALELSEELPVGSIDLLLLSHVLGECEESETAILRELIGRSTLVAWVEPAAREIARLLSHWHDELRPEFDVLAPCPHQAACPLLAPENERHWCHHFARTPREVFQSAFWTRIHQELGIDLRSLPYSCLVLRRKNASTLPLPTQSQRILGRPRIEKGHVLLDVCAADGFSERRLLNRLEPELVKRMDRGEEFERRVRIESEGARIKTLAALEPLAPDAGAVGRSEES